MIQDKVRFLTWAFLLRIVIVIYAKFHDEASVTNKFTDTDYEVFSDAATHVYNGGSPFDRHTYRYTPLAAYICLVNNVIHPLAGKIVFCVVDIFIGFLFWDFVEHQKNKLPEADKSKVWSTKTFVSMWIYNPMIIAMPCRGSNDNIVSLFLFLAIWFLMKRQYVPAGFFYGLAVHFKIYPIIYCFVLYFWIDMDLTCITKGQFWQAIWQRGNTKFDVSQLFSRNRLTFTFVSAGTFIGLTYLFYVIYGYEFLYEAYLYHFIRKDHRHNNSVYFYLIYQLFDEPSSTMVAILTFLPQWICVIVSGLTLYYDLWLCITV